MDLKAALTEGLSSTPTPGRPSGIEVRQDLSPAGWLTVQPPSYEGRLEIHDRYLAPDNERRSVIELDSVGSSANRIEEALIELHRAGRYPLPVSSTTVDRGEEAGPIEITTLETPHRSFDAWMRYSAGDEQGTHFEQTPLGRELSLAHQRALDPLLEFSAHDLLLGAWDSHRKGPNGQLRIARSFTSTIIGIDPIPQAQFAARVDPINLGEAEKLPKDGKTRAQDGLGSLPPQLQSPYEADRKDGANISGHRGGVAITSARFLGYLSFPSLRRLGFERYDPTKVRVALAALCLYGLVLRDHAGWSLRARCELLPDSDLSFTLVRPGGQREPFLLGVDEAEALFQETVAEVKIKDRSVKLDAGAKLNDLVGKAVAETVKQS